MTEVANLIKILEDGNLHPSKETNITGQSPYGPLNYVFFSIIDESLHKLVHDPHFRIPVMMVFSTAVLNPKSFWVHSLHVGGPKKDDVKYPKQYPHTNALMKKTFNESLKRSIKARNEYTNNKLSRSIPYDVVTFHYTSIMHEVIVKGKVPLTHLTHVYIPKQILNKSQKIKLDKLFDRYPNVLFIFR